MLEMLVSLVNVTKCAISYVFYASIKTGQFLVTGLSLFMSNLVNLINIFVTFCGVLVESLAAFFQDITQSAQQILTAVTNIVEIVVSTVLKAFSAVEYSVSFIFSIFASIRGVFLGFFTGIVQTFVFIKRFLILVGSGVWFAITLVPIFIVYTASMSVYFIGRVFDEIKDIIVGLLCNFKSAIFDLFAFVTDVPLESIAGLVIGVSLIYIFAQFYMIIIAYLYGQLRFARHLVGWLFNRLQRQTLTGQQGGAGRSPRIRSRRNIRSVKEEKKINEDNLCDDKVCVVCQERIKCVLLLPCRHVCLCTECSSELRYYNNACPVCRTGIESTMKIFV